VRRREFCFAGVAATALAAPVPWNDDRIGIVCNVGVTETAARKELGEARKAGFRRIQVNFPWARVSDVFLNSLPRWIEQAGLRCDVLSAYVNCCRPETPLMECREEHFARAIEYAARVGARRLTAWTGGYDAALMKADPRNFTSGAEDNIVRFLEKFVPRLQTARLTVALENYITLACPDAASLSRVLRRVPDCIGCVLDPPNLTPIVRFRDRDIVLGEMFDLLRRRVAVVHMKDFRLPPNADRYELPGPMQGGMNYRLFAQRILTLRADVPLIAEHIGAPQFAETRKKLIGLFRELTNSRPSPENACLTSSAHLTV
jgi:sugar phosphate isomerase/epimerase